MASFGQPDNIAGLAFLLDLPMPNGPDFGLMILTSSALIRFAKMFCWPSFVYQTSHSMGRLAGLVTSHLPRISVKTTQRKRWVQHGTVGIPTRSPIWNRPPKLVTKHRWHVQTKQSIGCPISNDLQKIRTSIHHYFKERNLYHNDP